MIIKLKILFFFFMFFFSCVIFSCNSKKQNRCLPEGLPQSLKIGKVASISPYDSLFAVIQDGYRSYGKDGFIAIRSTLDASLKTIITPPYKSSRLSTYDILEPLQFLPNEKIAFYLRTVGFGNCSFYGKKVPECVELFIWDIAENKLISNFFFKTTVSPDVSEKEKIPVWGNYVRTISQDAQTLISVSLLTIKKEGTDKIEQHSLDVWDIHKKVILRSIISDRKASLFDFLLWQKIQIHPFQDDLFYSFYYSSDPEHRGQFVVNFSLKAEVIHISPVFIDKIGFFETFFHPSHENALSFLFLNSAQIWNFHQTPRMVSVHPKASITAELEKDKAYMRSFSFSPDGKTFALGGDYEKSQKAFLRFWDTEDDSFSFSLEPAIINGFCSKEDETVASCLCSKDGCTYHRYKDGIGRGITKVGFDAKQRSVLVESDKYLYIWKCSL